MHKKDLFHKPVVCPVEHFPFFHVNPTTCLSKQADLIQSKAEDTRCRRKGKQREEGTVVSPTCPPSLR